MQLSPGVLKEGWGDKQGHKVHNWKHRFFLLRSGCLSYFKSRDDEDPCGVVPLTRDSQIVDTDVENRPYSLNILTVAIRKGTEDMYLLMSLPSERDRTAWKSAIEGARLDHTVSILKEGRCEKKSRGRTSMITNWRDRWFVLVHGSLYYFKTSESGPIGPPLGVVEMTRDNPPAKPIKDSPNMLSVPTSIKAEVRGGTTDTVREMIVRVSNRTERDAWVTILNKDTTRLDRPVVHEAYEKGEEVVELDTLQSNLADRLAESRRKKKHLIESGVLLSRMSGSHVTAKEVIMEPDIDIYEQNSDDIMVDDDILDVEVERVQEERDNEEREKVMEEMKEEEERREEKMKEMKEEREREEREEKEREEEKMREEREKEEEMRDKITDTRREKEIQLHHQQLAHGWSIMKHGRHGKPHRRVLRGVGGSIEWSEGQKGVQISDITEIRIGASTEVFGKRRVDDDHCFSLILPTRTVDIECDSVDQRDLIVTCIKQIL